VNGCKWQVAGYLSYLNPNHEEQAELSGYGRLKPGGNGAEGGKALRLICDIPRAVKQPPGVLVFPSPEV
jgi:hypothetical protein